MIVGKDKNPSCLYKSGETSVTAFRDGVRVLFDVSSSSYVIFPGFTDVHVHFREPGFSYKETIRSGSLAAAHGGYTAVCTMPNLSPVPDCAAHLEEELKLIHDESVIDVYPYGSISAGERGERLSAMEEIAEKTVAFSDDGRGVQSDRLMKDAMLRARSVGKLIAAHCEDNSLLHGGVIHAGSWAAAHGFPGISSESEYVQIKRDLKLAAETKAKYHVCHISTKESVRLIREAKSAGVNVTCETAPHYLLLDENDLRDDGRFKMNPPLRSKEDREELIRGICDGTIDMIATDHAPHSAEEKSGGLKNSLMGIVGLECAFSLLYTELVLRGIITLDKLIKLMSINPAKRFGIENGFETESFSVFDLSAEYTVDPDKFYSKGKSTPFAGRTARGECLLTVCRGNVVYDSGILPRKAAED